MSDPEAIKGTVELIEPMGDEILVHFMVENHLLVGKFDAADEDRVCERVAVKVDPEKLHVFDGKTGDRIA
jgi:ABC-type sugar transport system ATPase subunit